MPIERREIILVGSEPVRAVAALARAGVAFLPGRNVSAVVVRDAPCPLVVTLAGDPFSNPATVELTRPQVAEVLIRFCVENNIPLSRAAAKVVAVVPGPNGSGLHICLRTIISNGLVDDEDG